MSKLSFRSSYWDNIKGFLIFLVVFAHCLYDFQDDALIGAIVKSIYLFHMPAFIFVSGFFGKSERSRSSKSILTLLFAYFIFDSITGIIMGWLDLLIPVYSYWYIIALILWRMGAKYVPKKAVSLIVALIVSICVGFASVFTKNVAFVKRAKKTLAFLHAENRSGITPVFLPRFRQLSRRVPAHGRYSSRAFRI